MSLSPDWHVKSVRKRIRTMRILRAVLGVILLGEGFAFGVLLASGLVAAALMMALASGLATAALVLHTVLIGRLRLEEATALRQQEAEAEHGERYCRKCPEDACTLSCALRLRGEP